MKEDKCRLGAGDCLSASLTADIAVQPFDNRNDTIRFKCAAPSLGTPPQNSPARETQFRLAASAAKNVLLAADFTEWKKTPLKMVRGADGIWHLRVKLAPGRYRYQFLIDLGAEKAAVTRRPLPFGTLHGVVEVRG